MKKIVHTPHSILTKKVKRVTKFDASLKSLVTEMTETLIAQSDPPGVGLAANQVGVDLSLFIMKPTPSSLVTVCVNPKIIGVGDVAPPEPVETDRLEGCLSIPGIWAPVQRHLTVTLSYQTIDGKHIQKTFSGFKAVIVQHEVDHLNGVLFVQRALEQNNNLYKEINGELRKTQL